MDNVNTKNSVEIIITLITLSLIAIVPGVCYIMHNITITNTMITFGVVSLCLVCAVAYTCVEHAEHISEYLYTMYTTNVYRVGDDVEWAERNDVLCQILMQEDLEESTCSLRAEAQESNNLVQGNLYVEMMERMQEEMELVQHNMRCAVREDNSVEMAACLWECR